MKCTNCAEHRRCKDSVTSWAFFVIGLVATVAMRLVIPLLNISPIYGKAAWYIGILGFFLFFVYKFRISQVRGALIEQKGLLEKTANKARLADDEYELLNTMLCSLSSKKERINFFFIFGLSAVALLFAVYFDFFK